MHWSEDLFVGIVISACLLTYLYKNLQVEEVTFKALVTYGFTTSVLFISYFYPENTVATLVDGFLQYLQNQQPVVLVPVFLALFVLSHFVGFEDKPLQPSATTKGTFSQFRQSLKVPAQEAYKLQEARTPALVADQLPQPSGQSPVVPLGGSGTGGQTQSATLGITPTENVPGQTQPSSKTATTPPPPPLPPPPPPPPSNAATTQPPSREPLQQQQGQKSSASPPPPRPRPPAPESAIASPIQIPCPEAAARFPPRYPMVRSASGHPGAEKVGPPPAASDRRQQGGDSRFQRSQPGQRNASPFSNLEFHLPRFKKQ